MKVGSRLARAPLTPHLAGCLTKTCPKTPQEMGGVRKTKRKSNLCDRPSGDIGSRQFKERCIQPPILDDS